MVRLRIYRGFLICASLPLWIFCHQTLVYANDERYQTPKVLSRLLPHRFGGARQVFAQDVISGSMLGHPEIVSKARPAAQGVQIRQRSQLSYPNKKTISRAAGFGDQLDGLRV